MSNFDEFNTMQNAQNYQDFNGMGMSIQKFQFVASAWDFFGYALLVSVGTALSFGILYPFLSAVMVRWCVRKTLYEGRTLEFVGSCSELYFRIIILGIISIFTFGLGMIFYGYYFVKWLIENIRVN